MDTSNNSKQKAGAILLKNDWIVRQIEGMAKMLAKIIFNKESTDYQISEETNQSDTGLLFLQLTELIDSGKINEAENLLFDKLDPSNKRYLELAIDFYSKLNSLSDASLEKSEFSREEINEGLTSVAYSILQYIYKIYTIELNFRAVVNG